MNDQRTLSPWNEFVAAAYEQTAALLREALGDGWFEQGVEPHVEPDEHQRIRVLFDGAPPDRLARPDRDFEHLHQIVIGNWAAFSDGFDEDLAAAEAHLGRLVLIAAEVAVKQGALPENVIEDFTERGRALLEGLRSPATEHIERIAAAFPRAAGPSKDERELDKAVANTFPASDPSAASNPSTAVGPPED